ncbi:MAG: hypothetical protein U9Q70_00835 [Chloroflexota bacterium]|nr:hypothetical protein [Chloroflexota bacterium]
MISEDIAKQLHDRYTRGELLSAEEQASLKNWYALQDNAESDALGLMEDGKALTTLQTQTEAALTQLTIVTQRIQEVASENEALRRETVRLRQQLAYRPAIQMA